MKTLPRDMIVYLASELDSPADIQSFCSASDNNDRNVCQNKNFWINKIEKERPGLLDILDDFGYDFTYSEIYDKIYESRNTEFFTLLEDDTVIKGNFTDIYDSIKLENADVIKVGSYGWLLTSNIPDIFPPTLVKEKDTAIDIVVDEIRARFENDDLDFDFDLDETLHEIENNFRNNDDYTYEYEHFSFSMEKVKIY